MRGRWLWLVALGLACGGCDGCEADAQERTEDRPITVTVDASGPSRPISPWVYGINGLRHLGDERGVFTVIRFGGNRTSTYNWENNASNAGRDYPVNHNDGYLSESDEPGAAVIEVLDAAQRHGAAALITVPMIGRVAADKRGDGPVSESPNYLETRFVRSVPRCPEGDDGGDGDDRDGDHDHAPDLEDDVVCQDAFVRFVRREAERRSVPLMFALDNEPALWRTTHPLLRGEQPLTYGELLERSIDYAAMITEEAPDARVLGPATFGWPAMTRLLDAPDANDRDFLAHYLEVMRAASTRRGRRLLHALDTHWYPNAEVNGKPAASPEDGAALARLRMQLPRSLYDRGYEEPSWVVDDWLHAPIRLLPRLHELTREHYPDTELAITEWAYGGATHPSGAVAVADALGAMGRHGVSVATYWPLFDQEHDYALAAFRMYRAPAEGVAFGDRSIAATSSNRRWISAWASTDSEHPGRVVVALICRANEPIEIRLALDGSSDGLEGRRFVLDAEAPRPRELEPVTVSHGHVELTLPARSVTTLALDRTAH